MSKGLVRQTTNTEATFQERLRARLQGTQPRQSFVGQVPPDVALLLDISSSMDYPLDANVRRIDELRNLAANFQDFRRFEFGSTCREVRPGANVSDPHGSTAMHRAFDALHAVGIKHVVVITDGEPDNEDLALESAKGLKIDCFYVGKDPAPQFLRDLCKQTGGEYGKATLGARPALEAQVRERLMITDGGK